MTQPGRKHRIIGHPQIVSPRTRPGYRIDKKCDHLTPQMHCIGCTASSSHLSRIRLSRILERPTRLLLFVDGIVGNRQDDRVNRNVVDRALWRAKWVRKARLKATFVEHMTTRAKLHIDIGQRAHSMSSRRRRRLHIRFLRICLSTSTAT